MSQPNPATVQQQLQLQAAANSASVAASTESLMSNAFDLVSGVQAAQQFLTHLDIYKQQTEQQQQQQQQQSQHLSYHQQQQQQLQQQQQQPHQHTHTHAYSLAQKGIITSSSSSASSLTSSPLSAASLHINNNNNNNNNNSNNNLSNNIMTNPFSPTTTLAMTTNFNKQQHEQHQHQQQQQHSNILSTPTYSNTSSLSSPPLPPTKQSTSPTTTALLNSQHHFNMQLHHHQQQQQQQLLQMDSPQQQQHSPQQQNAVASINGAQTNAAAAVAAATTNLANISNTTTTASSSAVSAATTLGAASSSMQQQQPHQHQHQHQHHHHQHANTTTSPYKSCWCFGDTTYHMKILVPAVASGAIIGKGGETIASLQKDSGARVKMSKSHDFYPGTNERVCLITGSIEGIMTVIDFVMDKIREKPDLTTKIIDVESKQAQERDKQVKILVPNSTAGMIIGKGGAFIKQIKEESGSYVQISQKPKDISLQERCITIIGDKDNNKNACKMILSKIVEDPQSGTCLNVSYADINGPVANFNPTGSPYATNQNAINSSTASLNSTLGATIGGAATAAGLLVNGTGINLSLNLGSPNPAPNLAVATQLLEHIKVAMRGSGYSENATTEVCAALGVLAKYGVLGMGVGVPHANGAHATLGNYLGVSALDQQTAAAASAATAGNVFGAVGQVNLEQYTAAAAAAAAAVANRPTQSQLEAAAAAQFDPFRHLGSQATTPVSLNNNSFGLTAATGTTGAGNVTLGAASAAAHSMGGLSKSPTPGDLGPKDTKNVEIPEVIVGAILGPNGRSLVEIQHVSGANVQISKKGIFAPGTRNRIVTITGQPNAIAKAQFLIETKINEEESKRARQIPLATVVN